MEATKSSSKSYILESADGALFPVNEKVVLQSELFKDMAQTLGSDESEVKIPIPDIDSETLKKIIEFCQHFEDEPLYVAPTTSEPSRPIPNPETFEMKFLLSFDNDEFRKIILGANYLDIPRLVDACCYRLAMMIEGKSVDEVRKIFEISSDYTADEEEQLRMENQWYFPNSKATNPE